MANRYTRHFMFTLMLLIVVAYSYNFLLVAHSRTSKDNYYAEGSHSEDHRTTIKNDKFEQSLEILASLSPPVTSASNPITTEIDKTQLPWYFKDGTIRPTPTIINAKTGVRTSRIWPEEQKDGDRILDQLMFVPSNYQYDNEPMKTILLYNGLNNWADDEGQKVFIIKQCPVNRCTITTKQSEAPDVDAILFHHRFSYPSHRKTDKQVWILSYLESPYHTEYITHKDVFNWTATYRHDSDIVTPYARWVYYDPSVTQNEKLDRNFAFNKTKQVAWFVSNCGAKNERLQYARELAKYIPVDVYGRCGNLKCPRSNEEVCFQMLDRDYKFYLAFENSNCMDYVTEKFFFNGLQHNVLPIAMGGRREDYERVAPEGSYLHVDDYESPEKLAEYLRRLDADDDLYNEYFRWKGTGEFIDTNLFCRLCAMLHDDDAPAKRYRNVDDWWRGPGVCATDT